MSGAGWKNVLNTREDTLMTNKTHPPDKPYVYAFSSAQLVLLVCMVLALMLLSLMLGIRIERYQRTNKIIAYERLRQTSKPSPEQAPTLPEAGSGLVQPVKSAPAPLKGSEAKTTASPKQPEPTPPTPATAKPVPPPKPVPVKPSPQPKPEAKAALSTPKVEPKKPTPPPEEEPVSKGHYAVQVASSQDKSMAGTQAEILKKKGFESYVEEIDLESKGRFFRVMVGPFQTKTKALEVRGELIKDSRFSDSYIRYLP